MSKIRILPEELANQIAAGEVVERPASVVKELLENSLDAGADRIQIEIKGGGTRSIRIIDNGEGMDEDDLLLCFERHGTSKLISADQLSAVTTLGFRGEAIPSIAAVAKMTITSRTRDQELGTTVVSIFGSIKRVSAAGAPYGTTVEVADLFGNTPARRKFLRTARTEIGHIDDTIKSIGLARPDVALTMLVDDRETIRLDNGLPLRGRLAQMLNYHGPMIALDSGAPGPDGIGVTGLLVPPEETAPVAGRLRVLVNGRTVRDRLLTHAVGEGLRSFLLKGRYPAGVICVELPPAEVDVNVHPAKQEVRFRDGTTVHRLVVDTVRSSMMQRQQFVREEIFRPEPPAGVDRSPTTAVPVPPSEPISAETAAAAVPAVDEAPQPRRQAPLQQPLPQRPAPEPSPQFQTAEPTAVLAPREESAGQEPPHGQGPSIRVDDLLVIGSYRDLYIFCRNRDRLVVIDQHAAHERLLYEEFRRQYRNGKVGSQQLLFPVTIELTPRQSHQVEQHLPTVESMGFSLRDFGGTTWVIGAVPALAGTVNPQRLLLDVLDTFDSERGTPQSGIIDTILATMSCKAAVKAGDHLDDREIEALLKRMAAADLFSHCPHGRPVFKLFDEAELKKWFSRT